MELEEHKVRSVRSMAGKLGYLGVAVSHIACFTDRFIQQTVPKMNIAEVKYANGIVRDILKRSITV